jgi:hypothetical protein
LVGQLLGISLCHTRHIVAMPPDFAGSGDTSAHFVFQGNPLNYVSLWDRFGRKSEYAEYEELFAMLPQCCQDHLDWLTALENSIRTGVEFTKARNPHECAFGKWYYGYHPTAHSLKLMLMQFESPHAAIHQLADQLLGLAEKGQHNEALRMLEMVKQTTLSTLVDLFASTRQLLMELKRRVAVMSSSATTSPLAPWVSMEFATSSPCRRKNWPESAQLPVTARKRPPSRASSYSTKLPSCRCWIVIDFVFAVRARIRQNGTNWGFCPRNRRN